MALTAKQVLLHALAEGFERAAWHGPNLRSALRGVSAAQAAWRPAKGRHSIWEIALHAAFWKYAVARRLTGSKKREFPGKGRNWFVRDAAGLSPAEAEKLWRRDLAVLAKMHKELRMASEGLNEPDLERSTRGNRQTALQNIMGIAMHDVYHAGQIQLLKKLYEARKR